LKKIIIGNKKWNRAKLSAGEGEPTRVIAAVGLSPDVTTMEDEFSKAKIALSAGADLIDEESIVEPDGSKLRELILNELDVGVSSVPLFETCAASFRNHDDALAFKRDDILNTIQTQAEQGVDVMTLHIAYNNELGKMVNHSQRIIPVTSRSGAILMAYMRRGRCENPYRILLDEILDILKANGVVLSLGTALRPASICDGLDELYFAELLEQSKIVRIAWEKGVAVMVEAAGHIRIDQIEQYVKVSKQILHGAPLRSLGPTTCDVGAGLDHITGSIGGAIAGMHGCDFLTCTTRAEHIGLPRAEDIEEAVSAFKLAAYIADTGKQNNVSKDALVSSARNKGDWKTVWKESLFGATAEQLSKELNPIHRDGCSMCGPYCALRLSKRLMGKG
jgi:phosphomethylpyrimidine synthase